MKFGLSHETIAKIQAVFKKYSTIHEVIIYGSRAKDNYKNGSDIDLTIVSASINFSTIMNIKIALEDLNLPYQIDLSIYSHISNEYLKEHIDRVGESFYETACLQMKQTS